MEDCAISVSYDCCIPLRTKIFNYRQTAFSDSNVSLICLCNDIEYTDFVDNFYGHVVTGDLNIIKNKKCKIVNEFLY